MTALAALAAANLAQSIRPVGVLLLTRLARPPFRGLSSSSTGNNHESKAAYIPKGVMNWHASAGSAAGLVMPVVVEPEVKPCTAPSVGDPENDWLCAWCQNRVANEKERFPYNGQDEFTFSNPERIRFTIITFSQTLGCRQAGKPTLEHTWFPGYAWSYCQCDRCGQHLGWFYTGHIEFVGLIKVRIVRALCIRN
jgi:hypothetical protein